MDTTAGLFNWSGIWVIIILLFLFMFSGNWFGGFGWNNAAAWLLGNQNNNNNHDNTVDLINSNTQRQQQMMAQQQLANQTTLITQGFCNTNSNIEKAMLLSQQNTAAIIANSTAGVQKILDAMCANTITDLRASLAEARLEANNAAQTATLINTLRPYPVPVQPTTTTTAG